MQMHKLFAILKVLKFKRLSMVNNESLVIRGLKLKFCLNLYHGHLENFLNLINLFIWDFKIYILIHV